MTDWFGALLGLVLRLGLLLAGLVFLVTIMMVAGLLLVLWMLRALWAKLTGKPVSPWTFQMHRQANWQRFYRGSSGPGASEPEPVVESPSRGLAADVTDVEIKRIDEAPNDGARPR